MKAEAPALNHYRREVGTMMETTKRVLGIPNTKEIIEAQEVAEALARIPEAEREKVLLVIKGVELATNPDMAEVTHRAV